MSIQCVILWRNTQNGAVGFISDEHRDGEIAVFESYEEAEALADTHHLLRAFPFQIVLLEDL